MKTTVEIYKRFVCSMEESIVMLPESDTEYIAFWGWESTPEEGRMGPGSMHYVPASLDIWIDGIVSGPRSNGVIQEGTHDVTARFSEKQLDVFRKQLENELNERGR